MLTYKNLLSVFLIALFFPFSQCSKAPSIDPPDPPYPPVSAQRYVVAHYHTTRMNYQDGDPGIITRQKDIQAAIEMGIDGFAVNTFSGIQSSQEIKGLMNAAYNIGATNFKFFLSADMGPNYTASDIVSVIRTLGNDPHYLKINDKPVLSTYGGDKLGNTWWQDSVIGPLAATGHPVTFLPNFDRPNRNRDAPSYANWTNVLNTFPVVDGLINFIIPGSTPFYTGDPNLGHHMWSMLEAQEALAQAIHDKGKIYMAPYWPYYWAACHSARQYMEFQGGRGTDNQWTSIISKQKPELVQIITWNDYTESTYIQPTRTLRNENNIPTFPHLGFYELNKYYVSWYKTGTRPMITKDAVFYFYRTQPIEVTATNDAAYCSIPNPFNNNQVWGLVSDTMYVTTALTMPAELRVTSGTTNTLTYSVEAGIVTTNVPFKPGSQTIELWRGGVKLGGQQGTDIEANPAAYNYHVYSNYFVIGGSDGNTWVPSDKWKTGFIADWFTASK